MRHKPAKVVVNNLVAKHSWKVNKPATHTNKKTEYKRSPKHKTRLGDCSFMGGHILRADLGRA